MPPNFVTFRRLQVNCSIAEYPIGIADASNVWIQIRTFRRGKTVKI